MDCFLLCFVPRNSSHYVLQSVELEFEDLRIGVRRHCEPLAAKQSRLSWIALLRTSQRYRPRNDGDLKIVADQSAGLKRLGVG
jgi:hypothetical protein